MILSTPYRKPAPKPVKQTGFKNKLFLNYRFIFNLLPSIKAYESSFNTCQNSQFSKDIFWPYIEISSYSFSSGKTGPRTLLSVLLSVVVEM